MAQIGTFTRDESGIFAGTINTLSLSVKASVRPSARDHERAPDYRVHVGQVEIGAAWLIATDRRSYHLQLESTPATAMSAISWSYPQDGLAVMRRPPAPAPVPDKAVPQPAPGLAVETLRFDYAITGDRPSWRPLRAFDDGRQVYIEFPASLPQGEAPPLFLLGEDGNAQLVNYRLAGRFYVVDRLFEAAELRLGAKRQTVVRIDRDGGAAGRGGHRS